MKKLIAILLIILSIVALSSCLGGVEFELNFVVDGEIYDTVTTNGKEIVKIPNNPAKEGYTFDGWYWDKDEWQKPFTANSLLDAPISSNMSVYAKWKENAQAHAHNPSDWIEDIAATCKAEGSKYKECTECEEVLETGTIEKLTTHTPAEAVVENFVDSDCETEGSYNSVVYCSVCEAKLSSEAKVVEKKEHTPSDWITDSEATCKTEGTKHKECTDCEKVLETGTIEKLTTHTPADAVKEDFVDSDCKTEGSYNSVVYCSVCEAKLSSDAVVVEKKAHTPSEWIIDKNGTCEEAGIKHKECSVCGKILDESIIAVQHTPLVNEGFAPTCTDGGLSDSSMCMYCGKTLTVSQYIKPLGHEFGDWVILAASTEFSSGAKAKCCIRCGEQTQYEDIPASVVGLNCVHSDDNEGNTYITILNAYGNMNGTTLTIPDTLMGFPVGAIADEAFAGYSNIKKVVIPDSVTSIGNAAFRDCTSLKTVIIGKNVKYIGAHAFTRCPLTSVTFKNPNGWWMSTSSTTTSGKTISSSVVGDGVSMCKYLAISCDDYYYRRS